MNTRIDADAAAELLRGGGVIAYPTEAVWGLGCDPRDEAATLRLLALKRREVAKGLILIAAGEAQLAPFVDFESLTESQRATVRDSWPGPNTWIVPAPADAPRWITGAHDGVAARVSAHPLVAALCNAFAAPLVSTSANPAGAAPPRTLADFDPALLAALDAVVAGDTGGRDRPSDIRDARSGAALRA